jgi:DNA-directed RNA polymerase sigma subunit (sigma70/sigma32)
MSSFWQTEDGWPYADVEGEQADPDAETDEDLLSVRLAATQALSTLEPLEREVVDARFGLEGHPIRSMKQLKSDLGVDRADLRSALGSGLAKLRTTLQ